MRRPALIAVGLLFLGTALAGCGSASGTTAEGGGAPASAAASTSTSPGEVTPTPAPSPTPTPYTGRIFALGDSVMLGAATCMEPLRMTVDAAESRSFYAGADLLTSRADAGRLPDRVVVHLGTNGPIATSDLQALVEALEDHEVYWVNVHLPDLENYYYADDVNALLDEQAEIYPNLHVIDWDATAEEHPAWLYSDDTHLTDKGCLGFARMVDEAVREPLPTPAQ